VAGLFQGARLRAIAALLAAVMGLGACASSMGGESLTPSQRARRDRTERYNETMGTGIAAGAIAGAVLGALLGATTSNSRDRGNAMAAGAGLGLVAGAALGGGAGYYIAERNERYASREQGAQARLEAAQREGADLARTAALADQVATENERRIADLNRRVRAGQADAAALRREAATARADLDLMRRGEAQAQRVETAMRGDAAQTGDRRLAAEADRVATSRAQLRDSADRLSRALQQAPAA
jgi:hypothetical protein